MTRTSKKQNLIKDYMVKWSILKALYAYNKNDEEGIKYALNYDNIEEGATNLYNNCLKQQTTEYWQNCVDTVDKQIDEWLDKNDLDMYFVSELMDKYCW